MTCNCITTVNDLLKPRNTRLATTIVFKQPAYEAVTITTEQIETGRGKGKAVAMLPTFCPFCAASYREADPEDAEHGAANPATQDLYRERLQAIIDWADFALANPGEFNSHGVRNLDGPVFDAARDLLKAGAA